MIGRRNHDAEQTIKRLRVILFFQIVSDDKYKDKDNLSLFPQIVVNVFFALKIQFDQVEMEDWKTKSNKMTMELNELKAQYKELENKVREISVRLIL